MGSSVYNRAKVYIHQNFLKVVGHVIIIDQWNPTKRLYGIQVTVIYSRAVVVTVTSECRVMRVICKTWIGTLANSADKDQTAQNAASDQDLNCLLKLQEILRVKWNSLKSPFKTIFPSYTQRQSTHQCCQCFDFLKATEQPIRALFVLRFYGPVNPMGSCRVQSVYLTTRLLGRLSPLSG